MTTRTTPDPRQTEAARALAAALAPAFKSAQVALSLALDRVRRQMAALAPLVKALQDQAARDHERHRRRTACGRQPGLTARQYRTMKRRAARARRNATR